MLCTPQCWTAQSAASLSDERHLLFSCSVHASLPHASPRLARPLTPLPPAAAARARPPRWWRRRRWIRCASGRRSSPRGPPARPRCRLSGEITFYHLYVLSIEMVNGQFLCPAKGPKVLPSINVRNSLVGNPPTTGYHIDQHLVPLTLRDNLYNLQLKHMIHQVYGSQYHLLWMHFTGFLGHILS